MSLCYVGVTFKYILVEILELVFLAFLLSINTMNITQFILFNISSNLFFFLISERKCNGMVSLHGKCRRFIILLGIPTNTDSRWFPCIHLSSQSDFWNCHRHVRLFQFDCARCYGSESGDSYTHSSYPRTGRGCHLSRMPWNLAVLGSANGTLSAGHLSLQRILRWCRDRHACIRMASAAH